MMDCTCPTDCEEVLRTEELQLPECHPRRAPVHPTLPTEEDMEGGPVQTEKVREREREQLMRLRAQNLTYCTSSNHNVAESARLASFPGSPPSAHDVLTVQELILVLSMVTHVCQWESLRARLLFYIIMYMYMQIELPCVSGERCLCPCITFKDLACSPELPRQLSWQSTCTVCSMSRVRVPPEAAHYFSERKQLSVGVLALHCLVSMTESTCTVHVHVHVHIHVPESCLNVHSLASQLYFPMTGPKEQRKAGERIFLFPSTFSIRLWGKLWLACGTHTTVGMFTQRDHICGG